MEKHFNFAHLKISNKHLPYFPKPGNKDNWFKINWNQFLLFAPVWFAHHFFY